MYHRGVLSILVFIGLTFNQTVNATISGKVSNKTGGAIKDATLTLVKDGATATTGTDGMYTLAPTDVKTLPALQPQNTGITLQNGLLNFNLPEAAPVKYEIFDVKGNLLEKKVLKKAQKGIYSFNVTENIRTTTLLIIRASIGSQEMAFNYLPLNGKNAVHSQNQFSTSVSAGLAKTTAVADTIKVTAAGYKEQAVAVASYDMEKNVTMEAAGSDVTPVISNLTIEKNPNSVISVYVNWTTDLATNSEVQFGEGGFAFSISDDSTVTKHRVLVIGMHAKTTYKIRAISGLTTADTSYTTGTLPNYIPEGSAVCSDGSVDGWTLVNILHGSSMGLPMSNNPAIAVMYDHEGKVVWYRVHGTVGDMGGCTSTEFYENGNTVVVGATDKEPPREYDLAGNELWKGPSPTSPNSYAITHHVNKMSNGHYLLVGWGPVEKLSNGRDSLTWANLREVTKDNTVVWEWHLKDFVTVPADANGDYFHANSATVFPERDEVYVDCRWIGLIKTTYNNPKLIYHIPASYHEATTSNDLCFSSSEDQISDVHDPEIHVDDSTIMFFDNGGYDANNLQSTKFHSRVVEYKIDEAGKKATLVWEFPGTINSDSYFKTSLYEPYWGDADRLSNGNVLFTSSTMGSGKISHLFEVTRAGKVVWDFSLPADNGMYRAQRISPPPLVRPVEK